MSRFQSPLLAAALALAAVFVALPAVALADDDYAPVLVQDEIMPSQSAVDSIRDWTRRAFGGEDGAPTVAPDSVVIVVERQDYSRLRVNQTCLGGVFDFGGVRYAKGLGTHANSRLRFVFPEPVARFSAKLGIVPAEPIGSVRGRVETNGETLVETDVVRGGKEVATVEVEFPQPTREFMLVVDTTEDGPNCDQANWLEPSATTASGKRYDLADDAVVSRLPSTIPFSFVYDGKSSREFLSNWEFKAESIDALNDAYSWTDPETKLTVAARVRRFERFPAVDWVLTFTNNGDVETPIVSDVLPLDAALEYGFERTSLALHTLLGDSCDANSWRPEIYPIVPGETRSFSPVGGRPSNGAFPFWNITNRETDDVESNEGIFVALGWSGQWQASFENVDQSRSIVNARAGMEKIATILKPGETIRTPRVLLMPWRGERITAQVLFRRLLMFEYAPKIDGKPVKLDVIAQCFDRYYRKRPGWEKVSSQIASAKILKELGGTAYWFDAAWFPKGFPTGVGSWYSDPENFPNGVEELGNALRDMGLRFVLWFEPERVAPDTQIADEHPEFVFGGKEGGLFKLNDPDARNFLTELLLKRVKEYGVDVYRNDFNLDPLPFWRANDEPDRVGMTEIRYVEGHYEMWDRLISENPGLWIDDCASGGRRIDLETISRSVPLWRSDTCCWPGHPEWDQNHTLGLAQYLPLFSCSSWDSTPYVFRSAANPGAIMQYNFLDDDFNRAEAIQSINEAKAYQKYWYGDFYPLSAATSGKRNNVAWQLHRPDLDAGVVYAFRQPNSPYPAYECELRAIDPDKRYRVSIKENSYEVSRSFEASGSELANVTLATPIKGSATIIEYEAIK